MALDARNGRQYADVGSDGSDDPSASPGRPIDTPGSPASLSRAALFAGDIVQGMSLIPFEADPGHVRGFGVHTGQLLARLSGHGESSGAKPRKSNAKRMAVAGASKRKTTPASHATQQPTEASISLADKVGLTVRIEINLPAVDDQYNATRFSRAFARTSKPSVESE